MSVPSLRNAFLDDGKTATRQLVGEIRRLRDHALKENKIISLHFDLALNRLWVESPAMTVEDRELARENARSVPGNARVVDVTSLIRADSTLSDGVIYFTKKGYVEPSVIHLQAEAEENWTIVLNPFMTEIKVYDRYVDVSDI